jgi:hypothetical protein
MLYKTFMKLLFESIDRMDIDEAKLLLESRGIPVFVGNEDSARNWGLVYLARRYALWVPLDQQFEDAKALLKNKNHEVSVSIDVEDYYRQVDSLRAKNVKSVFIKIIHTLFVLAILGYILFVVYRVVIPLLH